MSAEPVIREGRAGDAEAAAEIGAGARGHMWEVRKELLGQDIYEAGYCDVLEAKRRTLAELVRLNPRQTLVAEIDGQMAGFLCWTIWPGGRVGEIVEVTVEENRHGRGIGSALCARALEILRERGCRAATVKTGGDDGHAVARALYKKMGFGPSLPWVQYFRTLDEEEGSGAR